MSLFPIPAKVVKKLDKLRKNFLWKMEGNMYIKVGKGNKTIFWKDGWIDQTPLSELFPD